MAAPSRSWTVRIVALALVVTACGGAGSTEQPSAASSQPASAAPAVAASESALPASDDGRTHVVRSGDTLSAIAKQFDTTVEAIVAANDLTDPDVLSIGDELVIPADE